MKSRYWAIGGVAVVAGVVALSLSRHPHHVTAPVAEHHQHHRKPPASTAPKTKAPAKPKPKALRISNHPPTIPVSGSASGSATASFTAVGHQAPPAALQVVTLPWQPTIQWAVEPLGMAMNGEPTTEPTLWFGERTGTGKWTWIPTTLPGEPSAQLPPVIRESLIMADSLHIGEPGPSNTIGNITWQGLQGKVGVPVGWTLESVPKADSPLFAPSVGVVLFQESYTGSSTGYYGMEAAFDSQNARTGLHGLVGFVSRAGSLRQIVKTPPPLL